MGCIMNKLDLNVLNHYILNWATDRGLDQGDPRGQLLKLMEEVGETAEAHTKQSINDFMDGVGDIYVVLTILCKQKGVNIENCIFSAYDEIKDRTGSMQNGVYIKKGDQ